MSKKVWDKAFEKAGITKKDKSELTADEEKRRKRDIPRLSTHNFGVSSLKNKGEIGKERVNAESKRSEERVNAESKRSEKLKVSSLKTKRLTRRKQAKIDKMIGKPRKSEKGYTGHLRAEFLDECIALNVPPQALQSWAVVQLRNSRLKGVE